MSNNAPIPESDEVEDEGLRWSRAAALAGGYSMGPWGQGVPEFECRLIEALANRILEVGEDAAWEEHQAK